MSMVRSSFFSLFFHLFPFLFGICTGYFLCVKTCEGKDKPNGTYMVLVSKHAFTIKDGTLIDNHGEEWRPTRKVLGAYQISPVSKEVQLSLDFS